MNLTEDDARMIDALDKAAVSVSSAAVPSTVSGNVAVGAFNSSNQFWFGPINSVFLVNPAHPNWTPSNQAKLLAFLKARGGIA